MKFCQECGKELFDDQTICPNCGTQQTVLSKADYVETISEDSQAAVDETDSKADDIESMAVSDIAVGTPVPNFEVDNNSNAVQESAAYTYTGNPGGDPRFTAPGGDPRFTAPEGDSRFTAPGGGSNFQIGNYNFWLYLLLSIVTCGIAGIYIMYKWTEDTNRLSQGVYKPSMNYIFVLLLGLVTCGIYPLVWTYQQGERLKIVGDANGIKINETGVHHLLISLLLGGMGTLVSTYIFFSNTNRLAGVYNGTITRDQANTKTSHVPAIVIGVILAIISAAIGLGSLVYYAQNIEPADYNGMVYNPEEWDDFEDFDWENYDWEDNDVPWFSDSATFSDAEVRIMDAVLIDDVNGDPAISVELEWTNYGDKETSAMWTFDIEAYQHGQRLETTGPSNGNPYIGELENYSRSIKTNEDIDFHVMFKLLDEETDVEVIVKKILASEGNKAMCIFTIE